MKYHRDLHVRTMRKNLCCKGSTNKITLCWIVQSSYMYQGLIDHPWKKSLFPHWFRGTDTLASEATLSKMYCSSFQQGSTPPGKDLLLKSKVCPFRVDPISKIPGVHKALEFMKLSLFKYLLKMCPFPLKPEITRCRYCPELLSKFYMSLLMQCWAVVLASQTPFSFK